MGSSIGMTIPNIWENKKCSKPPTSSILKFCGICGVKCPRPFVRSILPPNLPGSTRVSAQNLPNTSSATASRRDAGAPAKRWSCADSSWPKAAWNQPETSLKATNFTKPSLNFLESTILGDPMESLLGSLQFAYCSTSQTPVAIPTVSRGPQAEVAPAAVIQAFHPWREATSAHPGNTNRLARRVAYHQAPQKNGSPFVKLHHMMGMPRPRPRNSLERKFMEEMGYLIANKILWTCFAVVFETMVSTITGSATSGAQ